jgi:hypothetical protein
MLRLLLLHHLLRWWQTTSPSWVLHLTSSSIPIQRLCVIADVRSKIHILFLLIIVFLLLNLFLLIIVLFHLLLQLPSVIIFRSMGGWTKLIILLHRGCLLRRLLLKLLRGLLQTSHGLIGRGQVGRLLHLKLLKLGLLVLLLNLLLHGLRLYELLLLLARSSMYILR